VTPISRLDVGFPKFDLCQRLVGEAVAHDEAGVTGGAAEVHQAAFGEHVDAVAGGKGCHFTLLRILRP